MSGPDSLAMSPPHPGVQRRCWKRLSRPPACAMVHGMTRDSRARSIGDNSVGGPFPPFPPPFFPGLLGRLSSTGPREPHDYRNCNL